MNTLENRKVLLCPAGCGLCPEVEFAGDQVRIGEAPRIAQRERRILHRPADRPPDIDDAEAALQQLARFVAEMVADPARRLRIAPWLVVLRWSL